LPANEQIYISDLLISLSMLMLELHRLKMVFRAIWYINGYCIFTDPSNYYYPYAQGDREDARFVLLEASWEKVNLKI